MANSFHTCLYLLWSIPYFRFVLRRSYLLEAESLKLSGRLLTSGICFKLSRIIHMMDDVKNKSTYIADAWSAFSKKFENYRTHTIIDATDLFSDVLGVLHSSLSLPNIWYKKPLKPQSMLSERSEPGVLPQQSGSIVNNSPIFAAVGGEIEKNLMCKECSNTTQRCENFISLNFKKLQEPEIAVIREQFEKQGYREGQVYKTEGRKQGLLSRVFQRKRKQVPVVTIRDYMCHLNLLQREQTEEFCTYCARRCAFEATLTLCRPPPVLQIGLSAGEGASASELDFQLDLEFDPAAFFKHPAQKYRLQAVVSVEEGILGIVHYAICFRDASGDGWLKSNLYNLSY